MAGLTESVVEDAALAWLEGLGYAVKHLPAPQMTRRGRQAGQTNRLRGAIPSPWPSPKGEGKLLGSRFSGPATPGAREIQSGTAHRGN
ncbi:MAG: hypothetical protein ACREQW_04165 [Candidatus Binatia bacterium]